MTIKFNIGDRVKLSGKHLKSTGQGKGRAGLDTFTVTGLEGSWAITDQEISDGMLACFTAEELTENPSLRYRRIALANLVRVGEVSSRNCP